MAKDIQGRIQHDKEKLQSRFALTYKKYLLEIGNYPTDPTDVLEGLHEILVNTWNEVDLSIHLS